MARKPLPDHMRRMIARQHPEHARLVGFLPEPASAPGAAASAPARKKYNNQPCVDERGRKYDSKAEKANHLKLEASGRPVLRQVSLIVSDGESPVRMRIDHAEVVETDGDTVRLRFYDTKGMAATADWKNKAKALWNNFGIKVHIMGGKK